MKKRHLDLGCGLDAKNPYNMDELYGCDIRDRSPDDLSLNFNYFRANLSLDSIPFSDNFFDSVSAYDFLEHIPRQMLLPNGVSANPFVNLMSEIYRVLKPGGFFLASTPVYPHIAAFSDPTHVNFITKKTHLYFVGDEPTAGIYGFVGKFCLIKANIDTPHNSADPRENSFRKSLRRIHRILKGEGLSHMYWELSAVK